MKKSGKSGIYKYGKKSFRYDYDRAVVEWVSKASKEELKDEAEWIEQYGKPLLRIDDKGYFVVDSVGLSRENWQNKEVRDEYLAEWCYEIEEEVRYLV